MRSVKGLATVLLLALLAGCAALYTNDAVHDPYGFFSGVWHGLIFCFALLAYVISWACSLVGISFLESIELIGRPNTGLGYYVGFAVGLMSAGASASG